MKRTFFLLMVSFLGMSVSAQNPQGTPQGPPSGFFTPNPTDWEGPDFWQKIRNGVK